MAKSKTPNLPPSAPEKKEHRSLGKMLTYFFSFAILAVIVVAMVGSPALAAVARRGRVAFGEYDGQEIVFLPGNFFQRERDRLARQVEESEQEVTASLRREIWRSAFDRTIFHTALMVQA